MPMSLTDILREKEEGAPIWTLNKTRGASRGPVLFACSRQSGSETDSIRIPDTWLPINICEQLPRKQILDAPSFRSSARNGMISFLTDEEAEDMFTKTGAQEELRRISQQNAQIAGEVAKQFADHDGPNQDNVSPKVISFMEKVGDQGEIAVINSLRNIADDLQPADKNYIRDFANGRGHSKIVSWLQSL